MASETGGSIIGPTSSAPWPATSRTPSSSSRPSQAPTRASPLAGLRVGYVKRWMDEPPATEVDRKALDAVRGYLRGAHPHPRRGPLDLPAVDFVQADRLRRMVAGEMARLFDTVDLLIVPSLRDEMLTISNHTGHPSLTLRVGFVDVAQARSDWAPDPNHPMPTFNPKRRVPHGITLIGRLFDEGLLGRVGIALERAFAVGDERPPGF